MNYSETLEWMFSQLPMYQRVGQAAYKSNLDNTIQLDQRLGSPHRHFKTIHVGGTNGKGSVSHMLASILQQAGYKTGLYTSPHLIDFRERIKINGEMISEHYLIDFIDKHRSFFTELKLSFFEMTVGLAFQYFADMQVDIAVIEVGLGGRLDSTNIITPLLSVITNISPDHTALLGDTPQLIAQEKAGIIKPGVPVVIGTRDQETERVFIQKAEDSHSEIFFASDLWHSHKLPEQGYDFIRNDATAFKHIQPELKGNYQQYNIPTVLESVLRLRKTGLTIPDKIVCDGIAYTIQNTGLYGRWQVLNNSPYTVADTAHNIAGIRETVSQIRSTSHQQLHIVLGVVNDKDIDRILEILPREAIYYFTKATIPRALPEDLLAEKARRIGLQGSTYPTVRQACEAAKASALPEDMIYIGGSTFVVAEAL